MNAGGSIRHRDWSGDHLGDDASSQEGTSWPVATAVNANAVGCYFVLTRVTAITSVTARRPPAERPAVSQARWRAAPENQGYFRGPVNVARVQAWRSRHPGYWRRARRAGTALQDLSTAQPVDSSIGTAIAAGSPLQEVLIAQPAVLIGLIAHIVGTPLQDDIVHTTGRLLRLGQDILATSAARAPTPGAERRSRW